MSDHGSSHSQGESSNDHSPGSSQNQTSSRNQTTRLPPLFRHMVLPDWLTQGVDATRDPGSSSGTSQSPSSTYASPTNSAQSDPIIRHQSGSAPSNMHQSGSAPSNRNQSASAPSNRNLSTAASNVRNRSTSAPAIPAPPLVAHVPLVQPIHNGEPPNLHQGVQNNELPDQVQDLGGAGNEGKLVVKVDAGGNLQPSHKASKKNKDAFMMHTQAVGYSWKTVPPNIVELYWEEFQKRCTWDKNIYNDNQVYNAFIKRIQKRYSNYFSKMRLKNQRPKFVSDEIWKAWTDAWGTEDFEKRCRQNQLNRHKGDVTQPAAATHIGGSVSSAETMERLTILLGRVPTAHELFAYTHTKRHDGTSWSDPRAQAVGEEYVRTVAASIQGEGNRAVDMLKAYYEVVGGHNRKKRLYGLGDAVCRYYSAASSQFSSTPGASSSTSSPDMTSHLQSQLDRLNQIVQALQESQQRSEEGMQREDSDSRQL